MSSGSGPASQECTVTCPPTTAPPVTDPTSEGEKSLDVLVASPPKNCPNITSHDQEKEKKEDFIARVKQGWTLANVESLKIGELYLIVTLVYYITIENVMLILFMLLKLVLFSVVW